jgi:hypothetical protein
MHQINISTFSAVFANYVEIKKIVKLNVMWTAFMALGIYFTSKLLLHVSALKLSRFLNPKIFSVHWPGFSMVGPCEICASASYNNFKHLLSEIVLETLKTASKFAYAWHSTVTPHSIIRMSFRTRQFRLVHSPIMATFRQYRRAIRSGAKSTYSIRNVQFSEADRNNISPLQ